MSVIVKDNIIPPRLVEELYTACTHQDTPWQYSSGTYGQDTPTLQINEVEEPQYVHTSWFEGDATYLWPLMNIPLYFIEKELGVHIVNIQRCKMNVLTKTPNYDPNKNHPVHSDRTDPNWFSAIYYATDGDGDTIFTDKFYPAADWADYKIIQRVSPKKGRLAIFNSQQYHASSPTSYDRRIAINYVFQIRGNKIL